MRLADQFELMMNLLDSVVDDDLSKALQIKCFADANKDAILTALRAQEKARIAQINAEVRNKITPEEWRDACAGLGHKV